MSVKNKVLLIISGLMVVFLIVVAFWPKKSDNLSPKTIKTIPASVVVIPTQDKTETKSTTGAKLTVLSDEQYKETTLMYLLRQECPLKNDYFSIEYNYGIDKFVVKAPADNLETFLQWKKDTGYNGISDKYWQVETTN